MGGLLETPEAIDNARAIAAGREPPPSTARVSLDHGILEPATRAGLCAVMPIRYDRRDVGRLDGMADLWDRDADGNAGSNQQALWVYGRAGQPCRVCGTALRGFTLGGGYGEWKQETFRIGHMGEVGDDDLARLLAVLSQEIVGSA